LFGDVFGGFDLGVLEPEGGKVETSSRPLATQIGGIGERPQPHLRSWFLPHAPPSHGNRSHSRQRFLFAHSARDLVAADGGPCDLVCLAAVAYIYFLNYWNLLGWNY
jgi:hypothetical protein